jgi:predicted lipoprotein with Yx(FWY)xxD motif
MKRLPAARSNLPLKLLLLSAAVLAAAVALAACGGGSGGGEATAQMSGGAQEGGGTVSVMSIGDAGPVLVDSSGRALYASNLEGNGKIVCTGPCNSFWEPLAAGGGTPTSSSSVPGKLGAVKRPDGGRQVTYNGMPLYSFTQEDAEEVSGDGFVDEFNGDEFTWSVVKVAGATAESSAAESEPSGGGEAESSGSARSCGY